MEFVVRSFWFVGVRWYQKTVSFCFSAFTLPEIQPLQPQEVLDSAGDSKKKITFENANEPRSDNVAPA